MLSSLLRPRKTRRSRTQEPFRSFYVNERTPLNPRHNQIRHATADWTETEDNDEDTEGVDEDNDEEGDEEDNDGEEGEDNEDDEDNEDGDPTSLLPIFSAAYLDALPVYNITHAVRLIIVPRCETTLTWDQLRSPQVSQFLVKPMQQQIRNSHFSRATLYALMANCLQFGKEAHLNPGNAGTSRTRSMVCELLAIKLLKEYNTRELIDSLSYDFYPLQGLGQDAVLVSPAPNVGVKGRQKPATARISTLEVAIRAQAKRFLAHPLVVQQLEAIWAGTIVFHANADTLHRPQAQASERVTSGLSGASQSEHIQARSPDKLQPASIQRQQQPQNSRSVVPSMARRTVTLYDPRDASLFKLSRLRVPRYRQFFSTCSLAVLLGLYLAVLIQRSPDITALEIVFWLWSAGFMLDEIVGFNEQGFSLYIMSFWNIFDLGILFFLIIYYCMRLYGIFLAESGKRHWNSIAYDVLAANAVLLFPRLFSILDHYRYFSQLLIAFRLMAVDLVAVFVLIIISCSGFFVAFTLSFGRKEYDAAGVAFALFQMIMGFTPAAWEAWTRYNVLGKGILTLFLFICHFLIVTILISVLSNSFTAIVTNANEEHQFLFAVNTISMVKNDALFSYVAPSNLLAWFLTPLRYLMPFRIFVKLNRYVIKITHFPLLFSIFFYEKIFLARSVYEPTDLIENRGRRRLRVVSFLDPNARAGLFSPSVRLKQGSMAGFYKERALEDVFRLTPRGNMRGTTKSQERRQTSNVVHNWMNQHEGIASPPPEQDHSIVDRLERRRQASRVARRDFVHRQHSGTKSVTSDPPNITSPGMDSSQNIGYAQSENDVPLISVEDTKDDDGDDELVTNEEEENTTLEKQSRAATSHALLQLDEGDDYFKTPTRARLVAPPLPTASSSPRSGTKQFERLDLPSLKANPPRLHDRNMSSNTVLFNPVRSDRSRGESSASPPKSRPTTSRHTPSGRATPINPSSKPRPIVQRGILSAHAVDSHLQRRHIRKRASSIDLGMDIASDIALNDQDNNLIGAVPSSFATQMAMATGMVKRGSAIDNGTERLMGRLMLARMKNLEESFQEVVREFREMRTQGNSPADTTAEDARPGVAGSGKAKDKGKRVAGRKSRPSSRIRRQVEDEKENEAPEAEGAEGPASSALAMEDPLAPKGSSL